MAHFTIGTGGHYIIILPADWSISTSHDPLHSGCHSEKKLWNPSIFMERLVIVDSLHLSRVLNLLLILIWLCLFDQYIILIPILPMCDRHMLNIHSNQKHSSYVHYAQNLVLLFKAAISNFELSVPQNFITNTQCLVTVLLSVVILILIKVLILINWYRYQYYTNTDTRTDTDTGTSIGGNLQCSVIFSCRSYNRV